MSRVRSDAARGEFDRPRPTPARTTPRPGIDPIHALFVLALLAIPAVLAVSMVLVLGLGIAAAAGLVAGGTLVGYAAGLGIVGIVRVV